MKHGSVVQEEWGDDEAARKQTDNQVKVAAVHLKEPGKSEIHSERGMKGALPGFRLSSLSHRRQWTEHATR